MKVIERPDSKTFVIELYFHEVRDEKEAKNIMEGHTTKDIFIVRKEIDNITFQPKIYFALMEKDKLFSDWKKYVSTVELLYITHGFVVKW
jgi:hypothetical protein